MYKKLLIIDGSNLLHRAYWAATSNAHAHIKSDAGTASTISTIYIFLKSLKSVVNQFKPDETWIAWDKKKKYPSTNFRKELMAETYKQNRDQSKNEKIHQCNDEIEKWISLLGVYQIYPYVLEADDVISWLVSQNKEGESVIVSVDKDLLQLISPSVIVYSPIKKKIINLQNFEETTGVKIDNYVSFKSLMGDPSDNIAGIPGYGLSRSAKLASLGESAIISKLDADEHAIYTNNKIMTDLSTSFDREEGEVECYKQQVTEQMVIKPDLGAFEELCETNGLYSFSRKMGEWKSAFSTENTMVKLIRSLS